MSVVDMGKHLSQYGLQISDVSPKRLLSEMLEAIVEAKSRIDRPVDAILVGERVYKSMVDRLEEWTPECDLVPHCPDVSLRGIQVYVYKSEGDRLALRFGLLGDGKKVLEVLE